MFSLRVTFYIGAFGGIMMAENKLNRCECGAQVDVWQDDDGYYVVGCVNWGCPNCAHKSMDIYKSEESAIKAWNRRVEDENRIRN